jgi:hypothetical protein
MGAIVVVVVDELAQDRAQVALIDGYQVVEALGGRSSPSAPQPRWREAPESASADS